MFQHPTIDRPNFVEGHQPLGQTTPVSAPQIIHGMSVVLQLQI